MLSIGGGAMLPSMRKLVSGDDISLATIADFFPDKITEFVSQVACDHLQASTQNSVKKKEQTGTHTHHERCSFNLAIVQLHTRVNAQRKLPSRPCCNTTLSSGRHLAVLCFFVALRVE